MTENILVITGAATGEQKAPKPLKLNQILRNQWGKAHARVAGSKDQLCPFCEGKNESCNFRKLMTVESCLAGIPRAISVKADDALLERNQKPSSERLLEELIQRLRGEIVKVVVDDGEWDFDLGSHLKIAYRFINPGYLIQEMPLLREITTDLIMSDSRSITIWPSLIFQSREFDLTAMDEETQFQLIDRIQIELTGGDYQPKLEWTAVRLQGQRIIPLPGDAENPVKPDAMELLDKNGLCRLEELIYRRFSDVEEMIWRQMLTNNYTEVKFLCSDLQEIQVRMQRELQAIATEVRKELGY